VIKSKAGTVLARRFHLDAAGSKRSLLLSIVMMLHV
jgi:hypothetical protein